MRNCEICNKPFKENKLRKFTCSSKCSSERERAKNRECTREYMREYYQRPEIKAKHIERMREYYYKRKEKE